MRCWCFRPALPFLEVSGHASIAEQYRNHETQFIIVLPQSSDGRPQRYNHQICIPKNGDLPVQSRCDPTLSLRTCQKYNHPGCTTTASSTTINSYPDPRSFSSSISCDDMDTRHMLGQSRSE